MKFALVTVGVVLLTVGLYFFWEVLFPQLLIGIAQKDQWWSPLRLKPPSGQYAIISHGSSKGPMKMIIHDVPGHRLDDSSLDTLNWKFVPHPSPAPPKGLLGKLKLAWVGFNVKYYLQATDYPVWEKKKGESKNSLVPKERNRSADDPYYYFNYVMAVKTEGAETKDNFPLDVTHVLTARHRYPVRAQFLAGKWVVRVTAANEAVVRDFVGDTSFDDMVAQSAHKGGAAAPSGRNLIQEIRQLGDIPGVAGYDPNPNPDNVTAKFGLEFDDPNLVNIEITAGSTAAQIAEATAKVGIETRLADAKKETARGITAEYEARVKAGGAHAGTFAMAEAIKENTTATTLVIGNPTSIAIP